MRSHADSPSHQAATTQHHESSRQPPLPPKVETPFLVPNIWRWASPRPTPTEFRSDRSSSTPNMSRTATPATQNGGGPGAATGHGIVHLPASVPNVLTNTHMHTHAQSQGDNDFAMNISELCGRLDELLRGAGFPPEDDRIQDFMTQLSTVTAGGEDVMMKPAADKIIYHPPTAIVEYKQQPTEFQPGRAEHPIVVPAFASQKQSIDSGVQMRTQTGGPSRPQSAASVQTLPSMLLPPVNTSQSQGKSQMLPSQRPFSQHRGQQSVGSLNLGRSAPAYNVAGRSQRAATLPGQFHVPEAAAHLRLRTATDTPRNLTAIAETETSPTNPIGTSSPAAISTPPVTLAPDDAVSKHQAVYRHLQQQPSMTIAAPEPQFLLPPKQTSDNINQAIWNTHPAMQPVLELSLPVPDSFAAQQPPITVAANVNTNQAQAQAFQPVAALQSLSPLALSNPAPPTRPGAVVAQRAPERHKPTIPHGARPTEFRPMQAVLDPTLREQLKQEMAAAHAEDGEHEDGGSGGLRIKFSTRYYGMHTEGNASADHLTNEQNCALWLRNLPPDVTHKELLHSIRGIGRIWCTYINQPDFIHHNTAAAKIAFFTPAAARKYLAHIESEGPTIRGFRIKADYNRIKYPERPMAGGLTRVLIITGSSWFVNPDNLCRYFSQLFTFQVDEVIELVSIEGRSVVEFRFGSYRCQAQMGKMALDRQKPQGLEVVEFGEDPCETGETFISYRIATDRISKKALHNG